MTIKPTSQTIDGPIIQDDFGFLRSDYQLKFMNLKQGRAIGDMHLECTPEQFDTLYDMFCTARYKQFMEPNKKLIYQEFGTPAEYFSITYNDSEFETQHTLGVSLIKQ